MRLVGVMLALNVLVTLAVLVALRLVVSGDLLDEVRSCLQHPDWRVREQATQQLAQQATPDDTPALARLLDDPRWDVRMGAAQALARPGVPAMAQADWSMAKSKSRLILLTMHP